jgi:hypothetical protein
MAHGFPELGSMMLSHSSGIVDSFKILPFEHYAML